MQTDAEYHRGQLFFLRMLAKRPAFFASDYFRDRYETAARDNLHRLLGLLGDAGAPAPGAA
jgi:predicted metal-dependent HD superfamily phosphohydrolase